MLITLAEEDALALTEEADTVLFVVVTELVSVEVEAEVVLVSVLVVLVLVVLVLELACDTKTQFPNPLTDLSETKHDWPSAPPVQVVPEGRESARVSVPRVAGD